MFGTDYKSAPAGFFVIGQANPTLTLFFSSFLAEPSGKAD
jgi:hypothetical protein